jgi:hypothetical protein
MNTPKFTFTLFVNDAAVEVSLPAKFEVCPRCEGTGSHTNPSIDGNGITASEMEELGDEFREDYLRGAYDVTCHKCNGDRVISVVDRTRLSKLQKSQLRQHERDLESSQRDDDSERWLRMAESGERY